MKRPAFSFSFRQSIDGFIAWPVRMIFFRVDALERLEVGVGDDEHLVVDLVDQPAHVMRGEEVELLVAGQVVEVAGEVLRRSSSGGSADHVTPCSPDRPQQLA